MVAGSGSEDAGKREARRHAADGRDLRADRHWRVVQAAHRHAGGSGRTHGAGAARRIWGASLHSIMVGAVFTHLVVIGGNPAPVLVLLTLRLVVLLLRRRKLLASVGG